MADVAETAGDRLATVHANIDRAARQAGRNPADIELVAVSKTWAATDIQPLIDAGQLGFGENRVAEAQQKWPALLSAIQPDAIATPPRIRLHLVGQLQSNKAAEAVALFDVIHSIDRTSLVTALGKAMSSADKHPDCFVQVNIGAEPQKGGCAIAELPSLLAQAHSAGLPVVGLMCVPPAGIEAAPFFALLAKLTADNGLAQLSMGMSGDYETAVQLGATTIRVGSALFGSR